MEGYIENKMHTWTHALKRSIGPGAKIPLDEIYEQYGPKHSLSKGGEFVDWLRDVKLKDASRWGIVYKGDGATDEPMEMLIPSSADKGSKETKKKTVRSDIVAPLVPTSDSVKEMDIADVVGLSVRKAREVVTKIMDIKLLKYALQEANQRAGKDSLCLVLRRRIKDLELHRTM